LTFKRPQGVKSWSMSKRKTKKQTAKATLAEITKEMAKPRVAKSARDDGRIYGDELLVVENNVEQRAVNFELTVVANESQLPEPVHKIADP
jgi:hypothetical protein